MKTLFPPYAHPSPSLPLDNETWIVRDIPGERKIGRASCRERV